MEAVLIDVSEEWVGIVIGEESILRDLNAALIKKFRRTVHMRELRSSEKFLALRMFNHLFSGKGVDLYSLKPKITNWWTELMKEVVKRRIGTLYVDLEVEKELKKRVHSLYFKLLNIYTSKEHIQCADILAYGDSHHALVRNIWKDVLIKRGDP